MRSCAAVARIAEARNQAWLGDIEGLNVSLAADQQNRAVGALRPRVGEGGKLEIDVSPELIHRQITLIGSWVTSVGRMEELAVNLVRWNLRPESTVTERMGLDEAAAAYATADLGPPSRSGS